ncbi:MAG: hypothetical protein HYY06_06115 [Deltaproteobacteria bacterium]|nr:hypothetical protein [Deltaproteobacteria bacterium]
MARQQVILAALGALFVIGCDCGSTSGGADAATEADAAADAPADAAADAEDLPAYDPTLPELDDPPGCDATFTDEGDVRVIAMGAKLLVADVESIETFRDAMHRFFRVHAAGCLSDDRPNLIVWPEDTGLHLVLLGSRGADARRASTSVGAYLAVIDGVFAPLQFYGERLGLDLFEYAGLLVMHATGDAAWRALADTFSAMAERYGVTMVAGTNLPELVESDDPAVVDALRDPDYRRPESVMVSADSRVYNFQYAWGPDGELFWSVKKSYLVPTEEDSLMMAWGPLRQMRPLELPFGRFGVVISKDAWMPDVLGRLDDLGADALVQSEAFMGGWAVPPPEEWQPDIVFEASWNHTQRYGSVRASVLPCMTGNYFDLPIDGQSAVFVDAASDDAPAGFIGQPARPGFATVGPWVMEDPGAAQPELTIAERRAILLERGAAMLPGSGAPEENGYIASVVGADLDLTPAANDPGGVAPVDFSASLPLTAWQAGDDTRERNADLCVDDEGGVHLAFESGPVGNRAVMLVSGSLEREDPFSGAAPESTISGSDALQPAVACTSEGILVAAVQRAGDAERIVLAAPGAGEVAELDGQGSFALVSRPALAVDALDASRVALVFHADDGAAARIWIARSEDGGVTFEAPRRVDDSELDGRGPRVNQWSPAVAWRGDTLAVSYVDFRDYSWDGYAMISEDGGGTFPAAPVRVTPVLDERERLYEEVQIVLLPDGDALAAYGGTRERRPDADVAIATLTLPAATTGPETTLSADADPTAHSEWAIAASAPTASGEVGLAWQDASTGRPGVFYAERAADGTIGPALRVDDSAEPRTHALEPIVVLSEERALVIWEDSREGVPRLRHASRQR